MKPDRVQTERLGTLGYFDGMPTEATVRKVYDNLDFSRGMEDAAIFSITDYPYL